MKSIVNKSNQNEPAVYPYLRWSSAAQTEGDSERRQMKAAQQWCQSRGLKLSERTYKDEGVSARVGANMTNGALGELVKVAKSGDILLIEDQDRFSRANPMTAMLSLQSVVNKGIRVVFMRNGNEVNKENFNELPTLVPTFFAALFANQENEKRAFRIRESWEKRYAELRSGKATRMKLPGWLERSKEGIIQVNEVKAATVRRIFKLSLEGWGYRRIAQAFNAEGVPTVSGQSDRWNGLSIYSCILRNPAVIGDYQMKESKKKTGEVIKGIYPAVVTEKEFYAVQGNASTRKERSAPVRAASACLVTGLVRCPSCGGAMAHHTNHHSKSGKVYKYLVCAEHHAGQGKNPNCKTRLPYVPFESSLLNLLANSESVQKALGQASSEPSRLAELRGKLAETDRKGNNIAAKIEDDADAPKVLVNRLKEITLEAESLRAQLQSEERKQAATTSPQLAYDTFRAELLQHAHAPEYRERVKTALRDVIEVISFQNKNVYNVAFKGGSKIEVTMMGNAFLAHDFDGELSTKAADGKIRSI